MSCETNRQSDKRMCGGRDDLDVQTIWRLDVRDNRQTEMPRGNDETNGQKCQDRDVVLQKNDLM